MKSNELRIGNLIINETNDIVEANPERIKFLLFKKVKYSPIPLNEEWLLKFGFEQGFGKGLYIIGITESCMMSIDLNGNVSIGDELHFYGKFYYVHQLQNLYFALTQTELTLS